MSNIEAINVLECMAIDMTGALAALHEDNPLADVLMQRLEAINMAQDAMREREKHDPFGLFEYIKLRFGAKMGKR